MNACIITAGADVIISTTEASRCRGMTGIITNMGTLDIRRNSGHCGPPDDPNRKKMGSLWDPLVNIRILRLRLDFEIKKACE